MPIKKPYIKFRVKSMLPPEKAQAITNVQTDPNANGPNPNINTSLHFNVQLPVKEIYCPSLSCDVYDYVFLGMSQPLIGTFSIPIGALKTKDEDKRLNLLLECDKIIQFLQDAAQKSGADIIAAGENKLKNSLTAGAKKKVAEK